MQSITFENIWDIHSIHEVHLNEWTHEIYHYDLGSYPFEMKNPRWYLKQGESCPICFESINSVYLTQCGHGFHKSCYIQHMNYTYNCGLCPLCRNENDVFHTERYNMRNSNYLDHIENFWLHSDQYILRSCDQHHLGMCDHCIDCITYRRHGI